MTRRFVESLFRPILRQNGLRQKNRAQGEKAARHGKEDVDLGNELGCDRSGRSFFPAHHCINAPASSAIKDDEQEKPAIEDSQLAFVRNLWSSARNREKLGHRR